MALGRPRRLARIVRSAPGSGFGIFLVLFVPVVSNAVEIWENNRFRGSTPDHARPDADAGYLQR